MSLRLLFLNTRDQCGADVAVHLSLMKHFLRDEAEIFCVSNSEASDAEEMRLRFAEMPHVKATFLPLGKPAAELSGRSKPLRAMSYVPSALSLVRLAHFVRKHRIQVLHATDRPRDASFVSALGRMTGAVSLVHVHAPATDVSRPSLWGMRQATAVLAVSDAVRNDLTAIGIDARKIFTVHNAVDATHFDPDRVAVGSPSLRQEFGIPADVPLIGIAARMNPWKGQIELLGAMTQLREILPTLHLVILGANVPAMRADLDRRARDGGIADRVHFGGFRQDVRPFLKEIDLFVHPSYEEPFGLAIAEAMAMRTPVIACGTGGVPEIITHAVDGWLVEERSSDAVAAGIVRLLGDPDAARDMGRRARETVRARFSPRHQCAVMAQRYRELVASTDDMLATEE